MLRSPGSPYEQKRSRHLAKLKNRDTDEARVIGYQAGAGRFAGMVGALVCLWAGVRFEIGTGLSDTDRMAPPPVGALVTFQHNGVTDSGAPRFPVFIGSRDYE
jgi:DNA ligase-1